MLLGDLLSWQLPTSFVSLLKVGSSYLEAPAENLDKPPPRQLTPEGVSPGA